MAPFLIGEMRSRPSNITLQYYVPYYAALASCPCGSMTNLLATPRRRICNIPAPAPLAMEHKMTLAVTLAVLLRLASSCVNCHGYHSAYQ